MLFRNTDAIVGCSSPAAGIMKASVRTARTAYQLSFAQFANAGARCTPVLRQVLAVGIRAQLEGESKVGIRWRIDDAKYVCADLDDITSRQARITLRAAVYCHAGERAGRDVNAVVFIFNDCVLQPRALVFQVQYLVSRPAYRDDGCVDDFVVMLDTTGRVLAYESDQVSHGVTST